MGLIDITADGFNESLLKLSIAALGQAGIARSAIARLEVGEDPEFILNLINDEVEGTPMPDTEWAAMLVCWGQSC